MSHFKMGGVCSKCGKCRTILLDHNDCSFEYLVPLSPPVLDNPIGEQNCFLNACVQVLWNLETFDMKHWRPQRGLPKALKELCMSRDAVRSSDALRMELAKIHEEKFAVRLPADAAEAMQEILVELHCSGLPDSIKTSETASNEHCWPRCLAHDTFYIEVIDKESCGCSESERGWDYSTFILPVYASDLLAIKTRYQEKMKHYLRSTSQTERCCDRCNQSFRHTFNVEPKASALMLQIVGQLNAEETLALLEVLAVSLPFPGNFVLKGFIAYGIGHYVTYYRSKKDGLWSLYDDSTSRCVGTLGRVVNDILYSRSTPVLVVFEMSGLREEIFSLKDLDDLRLIAKQQDLPIDAYETAEPYDITSSKDFSILKADPAPSFNRRDVELTKFIPSASEFSLFTDEQFPSPKLSNDEKDPRFTSHKSDLLLPDSDTTDTESLALAHRSPKTPAGKFLMYDLGRCSLCLRQNLESDEVCKHCQREQCFTGYRMKV